MNVERRIRPAEFARRLGVSIRTLYNEVTRGNIRPPDRITPRTASWPSSYVDSVIGNREARS